MLLGLLSSCSWENVTNDNHFCECVHTNYFTMLKFVVIKVSLCCCFFVFFVSLFIEFILCTCPSVLGQAILIFVV